MAKPKTDDKARNAAQAAVWRALQDAYDAVGGQDGDEGAQAALESVGDDSAEDWASDGFRTRLGADVAVRGAMGEASYERLTGDEFDQGGGYLMFVAILDSSTTMLCSALGEPPVVLPSSHPFWSSHSPPMHFGAVECSTKISTDSGEVNASDVRPGMKVLTHRGRFQTVLATLHKRVTRSTVRTLHLASGRELRVTNEHPVLVRLAVGSYAWREARNIQIGNEVLQNPHKIDRVHSTCVRDTKDTPSEADDELVALQIGSNSVSVRVALTVNFDRDTLVDEREVNEEGAELMLKNGTTSEEHEEVTFFRGRVLAVDDGLRGHGSLKHTGHVGGIAHAHTSGGVGARVYETVRPMVRARMKGDECRTPAGDLHLLALSTDCDSRSLASAADGRLAQAETPFELAKASAFLPVLDADEFGQRYGVGQVGAHIDTVARISVDVHFVGELVDLTVDDDNSFVANGSVVHNCRSYLVGLTPEEAEEAGITDSPPDVDADAGFGEPGGYMGTAPVEADYEVTRGASQSRGADVEWGE